MNIHALLGTLAPPVDSDDYGSCDYIIFVLLSGTLSG